MESEKADSVFQRPLSMDYVEEAVETDSREFEKVVRSRRSVRVFDNESIPESVVRTCLELAILAPNSSNLQCWEFYWVREPRKKKELTSYCLGQPAAATAAELIVCVARIDTWKRNAQLMLKHFEGQDPPPPQAAFDYYRKLVPLAYGHGPFYLLAPFKRLLMNILAIWKPMPRRPASRADMRVWAHKSTALACENLMLALRAHGYDSCAMEGIDEPRIRKLLQLPRGAEVCMVISAGKRASNGIYGKQVRFDRSLFVFEV